MQRHIGVLSDTHGLLRPQAVEALRDCDQIIHAGDVGKAQILDDLAEGSRPVTAVRGNVDQGVWAERLPKSAVVEVGAHLLYVLHIREELDLDPAAAGFGAVVFGHSHRPLIETRDGVLYLNPGSAGPRRFRLPVTVARLVIRGAEINAEVIEVEI